MPVVKVKGMRCQHCVGSVTKALSDIEGIKDVAVSLDKSEAVYNETKPVDKEKIRQAISKIGFEME